MCKACGRNGGGYRQPEYNFPWVTSSHRLRWAFQEEQDTENEEKRRHPKLSRHEPRQQEELTSILSARENIHSEVCNFQQVDPRGYVLVVRLKAVSVVLKSVKRTNKTQKRNKKACRIICITSSQISSSFTKIANAQH